MRKIIAITLPTLLATSIISIAPSSSAQSVSNLEEIVVTANRREQNVQDVPLSISVVDSDSLKKAGVSQVVDLQNVVPGLAIAQSGAATVTVVRGVGIFMNDASAESAIAYNINGAYIARPAGVGPIFYDLQRVEVLKGPQGTLYGRNASGGAINIITAKPSYDFSGYADLDIGNYGLKRGTFAVTGGLSDTLALRFAGQLTDRDGYLSDGYNDQESDALRLTALWEPSDKFSLLSTGEFTHLKGAGAGVVKRSDINITPSNPWAGPSSLGSEPPTAFIPGGTTLVSGGPNDIKVKAISAEMNYNFDSATLTFIPSYRDTTADYTTYNPGFQFTTLETSEQQSYELRLSNESDNVQWVAGLYYFDEDQTQDYVAQAIPFQRSDLSTTLKTKSYAAFGEVTYGVTDRVRLIGGLRYSKDEKDQAGISIATLPRPGTVDNIGHVDFSGVNGKVGIEYDLANENLLFLTVSTGYKAGGLFPSVPAPNNSFDAEELTALTIGSRNLFLDGKLKLNAEVFYWKYDDKQERFLGVVQSGTTAILTTNAGQSTLYGAAFDIQFLPTDNDVIKLNIEYLKTKYDEFSFVAFNPPPFGLSQGYSAQATGCQLGPIIPLTANDPFVPTDSLQQIDCSGMPLVRAPEISGNASYEHVFRINGGATFTPRINVQFASSQYLSTDFINSGKDDGFAMVGLNLTYSNADETFSIDAWARNIGEEDVYSGGFRYPFSAPVTVGGDPSLFYANIRSPRTYGISIRKSF